MENKIWMVSVECKIDTGYYMKGMSIEETIEATDEQSALDNLLKMHELQSKDVKPNYVREFSE